LKKQLRLAACSARSRSHKLLLPNTIIWQDKD